MGQVWESVVFDGRMNFMKRLVNGLLGLESQNGFDFGKRDAVITGIAVIVCINILFCSGNDLLHYFSQFQNTEILLTGSYIKYLAAHCFNGGFQALDERISGIFYVEEGTPLVSSKYFYFFFHG